MKTRIKAPFATARRTADVLGVSKSRFKLLERLAHANTIFNVKVSAKRDAAGKDAGLSIQFAKSARPKSASAKSKSKMSPRKRTATRKSSRSCKGHSRAKA